MKKAATTDIKDAPKSELTVTKSTSNNPTLTDIIRKNPARTKAAFEAERNSFSILNEYRSSLKKWAAGLAKRPETVRLQISRVAQNFLQ